MGTGVFGHGTLGGSSNQVTVETTVGLAQGGGEKPITSYFRKGFEVAEGEQLDAVQGRVLADDGVIVYVNGQEVFRRNLPSGPVTTDTEAGAAIGGNNEAVYHAFSVDSALLAEGENVVAVEVHQVLSGSSDLGFDLELTGRALRSQEIVLAGPGFVRARTRAASGEWSGLVEAYFSPGMEPQVGDLVVSEIQFNPHRVTAREGTARSRSDFEYLELRNVSQKTLELRGLQLVRQVVGDQLEGVAFKLEDGTVVEPGGEVLVVADREAFALRYVALAEGVVLGEFEGSLGNGGEALQVRNGSGAVLASFRYDDEAPWPTEADGRGFALELVSSDPARAASWVGSRQVGGSPAGLLPVVEYATWAEAFLPEGSRAGTSDTDGDGVPNLVEFAFGRSPMEKEAGGVEPEIALVGTGAEARLALSYRVWKGARGVTVRLVGKDNLASGEWTEDGIPMTAPMMEDDGAFRKVTRETMGRPEGGFWRLEVGE